MIKNIYNLGDAALYCDFGDTVNKETNLKVINYFNEIRKKNITGINNIAPSYNKLIIYFDLDFTNYKKIDGKERYKVGKTIGRGAYGEVVKAVHLQTG